MLCPSVRAITDINGWLVFVHNGYPFGDEITPPPGLAAGGLGAWPCSSPAPSSGKRPMWVARVHAYVYIQARKRRDLERRLRELGWMLLRHGGKHDVWISADGSFTEYVPRHPEINERLAQVILRRAKERQ